MKYLLVALLIGLVAGAAWFLRDGAAADPEAPSAAVDRVPQHGEHVPDVRVEQRLDRLEAELARLAAAVEASRHERNDIEPARTALVEPARIDRAESATSPERYLELYVRSFDNGGKGSEFHRLAVEAYVVELVRPISAILLGATESPRALTTSLTRMFGDVRLHGSAAVLDTLLALLARSRDVELLVAALDSLASVGSSRTAWALEAIVWQLENVSVQRRALGVIVRLAGEQGNAAILRLVRAAPDEPTVAFLLTLLQPIEVDVALDVFALARGMDVAVRLAAAAQIHRFHDPKVESFVDAWIAVETDESVRRALGAARKELSRKPDYSPLQATGPPDAEPTRDDRRAWASQAPDGGHEWLELDYAQPFRASAARIHQVNSAGAITALAAIDTNGNRHTLWQGVSSTALGPFEITFPTTTYAVKTLRIELDTTRAPGWNEVDAVELVGPQASAWASGARASSAFGQSSNKGIPLMERFR